MIFVIQVTVLSGHRVSVSNMWHYVWWIHFLVRVSVWVCECVCLGCVSVCSWLRVSVWVFVGVCVCEWVCEGQVCHSLYGGSISRRFYCFHILILRSFGRSWALSGGRDAPAYPTYPGCLHRAEYGGKFHEDGGKFHFYFHWLIPVHSFS